MSTESWCFYIFNLRARASFCRASLLCVPVVVVVTLDHRYVYARARARLLVPSPQPPTTNPHKRTSHSCSSYFSRTLDPPMPFLVKLQLINLLSLLKWPSPYTGVRAPRAYMIYIWYIIIISCTDCRRLSTALVWPRLTRVDNFAPTRVAATGWRFSYRSTHTHTYIYILPTSEDKEPLSYLHGATLVYLTTKQTWMMTWWTSMCDVTTLVRMSCVYSVVLSSTTRVVTRSRNRDGRQVWKPPPPPPVFPVFYRKLLFLVISAHVVAVQKLVYAHKLCVNNSAISSSSWSSR